MIPRRARFEVPALTAVSRYGSRVVPGTSRLITDLASRGQLVEGPHVAAFEQAFGERVGGRRACAASYGRMAFYYILKALRLPPGGEIVVPALTFWVVPEMARVAGLTPVFADVDPMTCNMTAASFERAISPRTVAVVPTHLWGLPCDMDEIVDVARRHGIQVIEDCAHALGASYRGRPVGTLGDAAFFSLQTIKPLNTYGGGVAVVADADLADRVAALAASAPAALPSSVRKRVWRGRAHSTVARPAVFTWTLFPLVYLASLCHRSVDMYFWENIRPLTPMPSDYHVRYTNVQAALGLEALTHLDRWHADTVRHAERMTALLGDLPGVGLPLVPPDRTHAFYQYNVRVACRDAIVARCLGRGIDIETLHVDVCTDLELFREFASPAPGAEEMTRAVQVPVYEALTDRHIERVGAVLRAAVLAAADDDTALRAVPSS